MNKWILKNRNTLVGIIAVILLDKIIGKIAEIVFNNFKFFKSLDFIIKALEFRISISIFSLILSLIIIIVAFKLYKKIIIGKRSLKILNAEYGIQDKFINITNELNNSVENNKLRLVLSNNIAGDPYVGINKIGKIEYKFNGNKFEKEFKEGETMELP